MAARRYEVSLRVLNYFASERRKVELCCFLLTRHVYSQKGLLCRSSHEVLTKSAENKRNIFQHEKRKFVSPSGHKHQRNTNLFHYNSFCCEGRDLLLVIFTCEDILFSREISVGILLVFIQ